MEAWWGGQCMEPQHRSSDGQVPVGPAGSHPSTRPPLQSVWRLRTDLCYLVCPHSHWALLITGSMTIIYAYWAHMLFEESSLILLGCRCIKENLFFLARARGGLLCTNIWHWFTVMTSGHYIFTPIHYITMSQIQAVFYQTFCSSVFVFLNPPSIFFPPDQTVSQSSSTPCVTFDTKLHP